MILLDCRASGHERHGFHEARVPDIRGNRNKKLLSLFLMIRNIASKKEKDMQSIVGVADIRKKMFLLFLADILFPCKTAIHFFLLEADSFLCNTKHSGSRYII